jgi:hypothetical protein
MFDFIKKEITESRMFRTPTGVSGHTAKELGRVLYLALLCVELIRQRDEDTASNYAALTIQWGDFDNMRAGATDLANLISVLSNQDKFEDRIETNFDVSAPVLQIKAYLRSVWQTTWFHGRDRQVFLNIERMLDISDSTLSQVRRTVLDWDQHTPFERASALSNIRRELAQHAIRLDIIDYLPKR